MGAERREPFRQALLDLRRSLRSGRLEPGDRVTPKAVAERLKLSATPVREALWRLTGEGVLEERRGDGFIVPMLSDTDIDALYRLSETLLVMAQTRGAQRFAAARAPDVSADETVIQAVDRLFLGWAADGGSRVLAEAYRTASLQLAPARRREPEPLAGLAEEAEALRQLADPASHTERPAAVRAFFARRDGLARPIARMLADRIADDA